MTIYKIYLLDQILKNDYIRTASNENTQNTQNHLYIHFQNLGKSIDIKYILLLSKYQTNYRQIYLKCKNYIEN